MNTDETLPILITSPAWDAVVALSSSVENAITSQNRLIKEALNAWENRQDREVEQVAFQLIVFLQVGDNVTERIERFTVKHANCHLKVSLAA